MKAEITLPLSIKSDLCSKGGEKSVSRINSWLSYAHTDKWQEKQEGD
jgi:hypothetical protein